MAQNKGGRPLKFKSVEELKEKIDAFFADCDPHPIEETYIDFPYHLVEVDAGKGKTKTRRERDFSAEPIPQIRTVMSEQKPYTITGLALWLQTSRDVIIDYEGKKAFSNTIKDAKLKCQNYTERHLYSGKNATGAIFSLKNNFDWRDTTEVENIHSGEVSFVNDVPRPSKNN